MQKKSLHFKRAPICGSGRLHLVSVSTSQMPPCAVPFVQLRGAAGDVGRVDARGPPGVQAWAVLRGQGSGMGHDLRLWAKWAKTAQMPALPVNRLFAPARLDEFTKRLLAVT